MGVRPGGNIARYPRQDAGGLITRDAYILELKSIVEKTRTM